MFKALLSSNRYFEILGYSFRNELMEILFNVYYPPSAIGVNSTIQVVEFLREFMEMAKLENNDGQKQMYLWFARSQMLA